MHNLNDYETAVFDNWLTVYKRSATTTLILEAIREGNGTRADIEIFISERTGDAWSIDEKSMHRVLRRLTKAELTSAAEAAVPGTGLKKKVYTLTKNGERVLEAMLAVQGGS